MSPDDIKITKENHQLLALTERPVWAVFVNIVDADMQALDRISSLIVEGKTPEELTREVLLRYQTRETVIKYINDAIERAEAALLEQQEQKSDIINIRE